MGPNWEELIALAKFKQLKEEAEEETKQKKAKFKQFTNRRCVASIIWLSNQELEESPPNENEPEEALPKAKPEAKPKEKPKQSWPLSEFGQIRKLPTQPKPQPKPKENAKAQTKAKAQAKEKDNPKAKPNQRLHLPEALPHTKPKASALSWHYTSKVFMSWNDMLRVLKWHHDFFKELVDQGVILKEGCHYYWADGA